MTRPVDGPVPRATVLDRLLDAESELEDRLATARREADARVEAAERLVRERVAGLDAELDAARSESARRVAASVRERLHALQTGRDAALERLDRKGRERIPELAAWIVDHVIGHAGGLHRP